MTQHFSRSATIFFSELPSWVSRTGVTFYRGVLIVWDEDYDERIYDWIDSLPADVARRLMVAGERKGMLHLVWFREIPDGYKEQDGVNTPDDHWIICSSATAETTRWPDNVTPIRPPRTRRP